MTRYEIRTSKRADAHQIDQLSRAFGRTAVQRSAAVEAVEVFDGRGCLQVAMWIDGTQRSARREGERSFALAWYDAFGTRGSNHIGWVTGSAAAPQRCAA